MDWPLGCQKPRFKPYKSTFGINSGCIPAPRNLMELEEAVITEWENIFRKKTFRI